MTFHRGLIIPPARLRIPQGRIDIDGSEGEGGGQVIRTACALSILTGIACRITRIRQRRRPPGLRPQHCAALRGLATLSGARTSPLRVGATELDFEPGVPRGGDLEIRTGTAGSVGLVLQALLLAGLGLREPVSILLRGGTDVPRAPSCDYLRQVKLPVLSGMGYRVSLKTVRRGYFPKGGGEVMVRITPPKRGLLKPLTLDDVPHPTGAAGISHASSRLAGKKVAERQRKEALHILTSMLHLPCRIAIQYDETLSAGAGIVLWARSEGSVIAGSALADSRRTAEQTARDAAEALLRTYHAGAAFDPWLGDQILPYLALCDGPSSISVPYLTRHMRTNMEIVRRFLDVEFHAQEENDRVRLGCRPS